MLSDGALAGEEDNVYHKAMMFSQAGNVITNVAAGDLQAIPNGEKKAEQERIEPTVEPGKDFLDGRPSDTAI